MQGGQLYSARHLWIYHLTPEVHESGDVSDRVCDGDEDEDAGENVEEEEQGGDQDAEEGQADVPVELLGDYLWLMVKL